MTYSVFGGTLNLALPGWRCIALNSTENGSDTNVEADRIVVVKHAMTSSSPASMTAERWTDVTSTGVGLERDHEDSADVSSVNVFVVESKQVDTTTDDGTSHGDMKPLLIQHDVDDGFEPALPQTEPVKDTGVQEKISGPAATPVTGLPSFHTAAAAASAVSAVADTDAADLRRSTEVGRMPDATPPNRMVTQPEPEVYSTEEPSKKVEAAGRLRQPVAVEGRQPAAAAEQRSAVSEGRRPVVELSFSAVMDFYVSWFEQPWIAYFLIVVASTLMASAADADPAALIIVVVISAAFCFLLFPPPSDDDTTHVKTRQ